KDIIQQSTPVVADESLIQDFNGAPNPRQSEIAKFLISIALDKTQSDIVQQNAYNFLQNIAPFIQNAVKLELAAEFEKRLGRSSLDLRHARVALAAGVFSYLRKTKIKDLFGGVYAQMENIGTHWSSHSQHGELLRSFQEIGGIDTC